MKAEVHILQPEMRLGVIACSCGWKQTKHASATSSVLRLENFFPASLSSTITHLTHWQLYSSDLCWWSLKLVFDNNVCILSTLLSLLIVCCWNKSSVPAPHSRRQQFWVLDSLHKYGSHPSQVCHVIATLAHIADLPSLSLIQMALRWIHYDTGEWGHGVQVHCINLDSCAHL